jgi:3',5'-cyclic AMP phosphodiesterase CpdA
VFAVEDTTAQLVWRDGAPGTVTVHGPAGTTTTPSDGGPGSAMVAGLPPGSATDLDVVTADGTHHRVRVRTLAPPPGPERFRFATISDLHLGEEAFGFLRTIREEPPPPQRHPERALRAALAELSAWGAQLVVVKGDVTSASLRTSWALFAELIADLHIPVLVMPGNHDTAHYHQPSRPSSRGKLDLAVERRDAYTAAREFGLTTVDPTTGTAVLDRPGVRIVAADTVVAHGHAGTIRRTEPSILDAALSSTVPLIVLLHHQLDASPLRTFWPPGIPYAEADPFLRRLHAAHGRVLVTSGHTHRHRRHVRHGVVTAEVGSTKDYPGTWSGYVVHSQGIRQVVRRVADADVLRWTERTGRAALGAWRRWSPGRLSDRCFVLG